MRCNYKLKLPHESKFFLPYIKITFLSPVMGRNFLQIAELETSLQNLFLFRVLQKFTFNRQREKTVQKS